MNGEIFLGLMLIALACWHFDEAIARAAEARGPCTVTSDKRRKQAYPVGVHIIGMLVFGSSLCGDISMWRDAPVVAIVFGTVCAVMFLAHTIAAYQNARDNEDMGEDDLH